MTGWASNKAAWCYFTKVVWFPERSVGLTHENGVLWGKGVWCYATKAGRLLESCSRLTQEDGVRSRHMSLKYIRQCLFSVHEGASLSSLVWHPFCYRQDCFLSSEMGWESDESLLPMWTYLHCRRIILKFLRVSFCRVRALFVTRSTGLLEQYSQMEDGVVVRLFA